MKITLLIKAFNSLSHCNLVHKPIPKLEAMSPGRNSSRRRGVGQARKAASMASVTKVKSKKGVTDKAQKRGRGSLFCYDDGLMPPQEIGVGGKVPKMHRARLASR